MSSAVEARGAIFAPSLVTCAAGPGPLRGSALSELEVITDGAVVWEDGLVTYAGPAAGVEGGVEPTRLASGTVIPGFVDAHTHLPFFGWRADEFEARLAGRTYRDIHGEGGIFHSARLLAGASDDEVIAFCRPLAAEMLAHGTTAFEMKTGYGLSVEAELHQARLARRLAGVVEQTCTVTLLACHAVPPEMERSAWVELACDELIPRAADEGLVDAVDVYVEDIAFSIEDMEQVAAAASAAGLPLRCHADQLGSSGAAEAAVRLGARSADHLNHVSEAGVRALAESDTLATLLPASTFILGAAAPPARALLEAGAAVAVATDFNPGTSPVLSMPEVVSMACVLYGLPPMSVLGSTTINAAWVLGLEGRLGSLEVGKRADFAVLDAEAFRDIPYRPGHNPVRAVFVGGRRVAGDLAQE
jgi:imidazolonepropionase